MKSIYDKVSLETSKNITRKYSTSFSFGIFCLSKSIHKPIYNIYGFVRIADEIVDSFHEYNKKDLLEEFKIDTYKAIERGISTNPVLNSFQQVVNEFDIPLELIEAFLHSMEMDLGIHDYNQKKYDAYIFGSAEVVGLMCLKVFTKGNESEYEILKPYAKTLGSAFQKVNFLRDLNADYHTLGRLYFPNINLDTFNFETKKEIEKEIEAEFKEALTGIKKLPLNARFGVYVAYIYYINLLKKIQKTSPNSLLHDRIRIPAHEKISLLLKSYFKYNLKFI